jgi:peroxiredoxin
VGISVDSPWSHRAWVEERGAELPLLSDLVREVVEKYGVGYGASFSERAYFAVAPEGVVQCKKGRGLTGYPPAVEEDLEDLGRAL